ncbi:MAG: hypothetical protein MK008_08510 [Bdellovibrionales bacterium]|nr:hypothetical protein [Bdellovibrionales bacterium]
MIFIFSFLVLALSGFAIVNATYRFIDSSLSYFPKTKRVLEFFYKDIPLIVFGSFALVFEMFSFIKEMAQNLIDIFQKSQNPVEAKSQPNDSAQKAALDLLMDDEDEDIEMVHVKSVNQKINEHDNDKIETLRRVVSGFSDIKNYKFEGAAQDTQYLKIYLSPKEVPLDKNFEIFSTFIQQWPKSNKQRLIMTDFNSLKEPSFMDVVEGKVNLSRVIRKNLAPNTDVLAKASINNQVSEKKLFSLVSLLKDQYDEVVVLIPEGQEPEWETAYQVFNSEGFVQASRRNI